MLLWGFQVIKNVDRHYVAISVIASFNDMVSLLCFVGYRGSKAAVQI